MKQNTSKKKLCINIRIYVCNEVTKAIYQKTV